NVISKADVGFLQVPGHRTAAECGCDMSCFRAVLARPALGKWRRLTEPPQYALANGVPFHRPLVNRPDWFATSAKHQVADAVGGIRFRVDPFPAKAQPIIVAWKNGHVGKRKLRAAKYCIEPIEVTFDIVGARFMAAGPVAKVQFIRPVEQLVSATSGIIGLFDGPDAFYGVVERR